MKEILFKKKIDLTNRIKSFSISSDSEDKECKTHVEKSFLYNVLLADKTEDLEPPQIHIKKSIDTAKKLEKFNFQVKGSFYMTRDRVLIKVDFHHTLNIEIVWKTKIFSPKKSEVLTDQG